tara:strand:+ start:767 stop:931 length:165 start_codon:yes stop_codon:yes gene_type:complete
MFTLPLEWQRENTILLRHAQQGFAAIPINFATKTLSHKEKNLFLSFCLGGNESA